MHGNHNPLNGWSHAVQMPETVHVFQDSLESVAFQKNGAAVARIHGISYPRRDIDADFGKEMRREGDEPFQIGLLHCNAGGNTASIPTLPDPSRNWRRRSWTTGPWGTFTKGPRSVSPTRSSAFRETPRGGTSTSRGPAAVCLSALPRTAISRSVPSGCATDQVRWMPCELDIAGITTIDDLLDAVDDRMDDLARECEGRTVITRVTIAGRGPLHRDLTRPETLAAVGKS